MTDSLTTLFKPQTPLAAYREAPHNIEAEQALLGALLVNNEACHRIGDTLVPEHFYEPVHGRIFTAIAKLVDRGLVANPVTLKHAFEQDDGLAEVGGASYLARLAGAAVTIVNVAGYARMIVDLGRRRALIRIGEDLVNRAFEAAVDDEAEEQIEAAEQRLFDLAERGEADRGFAPLSKALAAALTSAEIAYKRDGKISGVPTGFLDLDAKLGGLHNSDLVILAARPAMGKTSLATNIALNAARLFKHEAVSEGRRPLSVGVFSLEMSAEQIAGRILADIASVSSHKLRTGQVHHDEWPRIVAGAQEIDDLPLFIDDTAALTISAVRTRARRLKRNADLGLVVIDYLQLLRPSSQRRNDNRVNEVTEITQGLKALAKELDVPVLALSQLSRAPEQRDDKRPLLADLRESGSIEQDADVVMFLFREEYYLERKEPDTERQPKEHAEWQEAMNRVHNLAEVILAKQRHGPTGTVHLMFNREFTRFGNYESGDYSTNAPF
ncbi:MAG: replicative DNA helicase [Alphaproteobacteria bacterium]|nr:replicative DNA helicase [Alphaproteobacteria bacterium]